MEKALKLADIYLRNMPYIVKIIIILYLESAIERRISWIVDFI